MTTTTTSTSTTTAPYSRTYFPRLNIQGSSSSDITFSISEFVTGWINNPDFNTTNANVTVYTEKTANLVPLFTTNSAYTTGSGIRYGQYRTPDSLSLAYWVNYSLVNGYSIANTALLDAFFTSADLITTGYLANRHLTQNSSFISMSGVSFESN